MKKYKCNYCEYEFDDPDSYNEAVGEYWGQPAYQTFYICPKCGLDDYEEVYEKESE